MAPPLPLLAQPPQKPRYIPPIHVIAPALPLRLQHVPLRCLRIRREGFRVLSRGGIVEGVDGCEGVADAGGGGGGGQEAREVRGVRGGEDLLNFLRTGEVRKDGGAFDRGRALEVEAGLPGPGGFVFGRCVAGAEVERCDFILCFGGVGGGVD